MIEIVVSRGQMRALKEMLRSIPKDIPRALARALNKVGKLTHTKILKRIASEYTVTQRELKKRNISLRKAHFKNLTAIIRISGRRIRLLAFKAKQTKKGVTYKIKKTGRRKLVYGFKESPPESGKPTTMPGGHRGVFKRKGRKRLPIIELYGPSVPAIFQNIRAFTAATFQREIGNKLGKEMMVQAGLMLQRKRRISFAA